VQIEYGECVDAEDVDCHEARSMQSP
jgi:hypothetical protein